MLKKTASKIVQEKGAKAGNLISNKFIDKIKKTLQSASKTNITTNITNITTEDVTLKEAYISTPKWQRFIYDLRLI